MNEDNSILKHIGVPGMKWGVRKEGESGGGNKPGGQKPQSAAPAPKPVETGHRAILVAKKKKLEELSNAELEQFAKRVALEKQYRDLTVKPAEKKYVNELVKSFAKQTAEGLVKKSSEKASEELFKLLITKVPEVLGMAAKVAKVP